jgi:hypothetical protein
VFYRGHPGLNKLPLIRCTHPHNFYQYEWPIGNILSPYRNHPVRSNSSLPHIISPLPSILFPFYVFLSKLLSDKWLPGEPLLSTPQTRPSGKEALRQAHNLPSHPIIVLKHIKHKLDNPDKKPYNCPHKLHKL